MIRTSLLKLHPILTLAILAAEAAGQDALPPQLDKLQPWQRSQVCGANLLFVLLKAEGVEISRDEIVQFLSPPASGSSLEEISTLAQKYRLLLTPVRGTNQQIDQFNPPWIAHLEGNGRVDHFLLVLDVKPQAVTVLDGGHLQTFDMRKELFFQRWTGYALILDRGMVPRLVRAVWITSIILCAAVLLTTLGRRLTKRIYS